MTKTKLLVLIAVGVIGYLGWAVMAWFDPVARADFLKVHVLAVTGVLAMALRETGNPPPPSAPTAPAAVPIVPATPAQPNV